MDDLAVKVAEIDQRSKSNMHRIEDLERQNEALLKLATSVEVMATKQDTMSRTLDRLDNKVETLEAVPAKRWEAAVCAVISCIVGFVAALVLHGGA